MPRGALTIIVRGGLPAGTIHRQATVFVPGRAPIDMCAWPDESAASFDARADAATERAANVARLLDEEREAW
jgi:hypothetical protein